MPVLLLASPLSLPSAQFTARWVGTSNGSWNAPTNWDIGRAPNNGGGDVYDVVWDANPIVLSVDQPSTIHNCTLSAGGTLELLADLTVQGDLSWSTGPIEGVGVFSIEAKTTHPGSKRADLSTKTATFKGGFSQRDGKLRLDGVNINAPSDLQIDGGELSGFGFVNSARVNGLLTPSPRVLSFNTLTLGPAAQTSLKLSGTTNFDQLKVTGSLVLDGGLEVQFSNGFEASVQSSDSFEIISVQSGSATVQGSFNNVPFGQRLMTSDGFGSFLVEQVPSGSGSVVLTNFVAAALALEFSPTVIYPFPPSVCVLDPAASVRVASVVNWTGGSLEVKLMTGFDSAHDRLDVQNVGNGPGEIGLSSGRIFYGGTEFATMQTDGASGRIAFALEANATTEAIQVLLQSLTFHDDVFGLSNFTSADTRLPGRTLQLTLTDSTGEQARVTESIQFPYLVGMRCTPLISVLDADQETKISLVGEFSNGYSDLVPLENIATRINCYRASSSISASGPGYVTAKAGAVEGICVLELTAGSLVARAGLSANDQHLMHFLYLLSVLLAPSSPLPLPAQPGASPSTISLPTFHALRNLMEQTGPGRSLSDTYLRHTGELLAIVRTNISLAQAGLQLVLDFQSSVSALLSGAGNEVQITQEKIDRLNSVVDQVAAVASPQLKAALQNERAQFNGLQGFVNLNFSQWAGLLQILAPATPWVFISNARRSGTEFTVDANSIPGMALSFWRTSDLKAWEVLPNAQVQISGYAVRFTDANAPVGQVFYQVRAQALAARR